MAKYMYRTGGGSDVVEHRSDARPPSYRIKDVFVKDGVEYVYHPTKGWRRRKLPMKGR